MRFALLALLAGCYTETLHARPAVLALHEPELVTKASANVEIEEGGTTSLAANKVLSVWVPSVTTFERKRCVHVPKLPFTPCVGEDRSVANADVARDVTIRELVTGCASGTCLAKQLKEEPLEIGMRTRVSGEAIARTIASLATIALSGYCFLECKDTAKTAGVAGLVISGVLLYQPIALIAH